MTNHKRLKSSERKISKVEDQIRKQKIKLAKLRGKAPLEPVEDYELTLSDGKKTRLSALFGRQKELVLIHNMGTGCPYCTLWADGFNGLVSHLEDQAAFVLESPDRPETQRKFAKRRGWDFRMVSSRGSSFRRDLRYEDREGNPIPGISTFIKDKRGRIFRRAHTRLGPGDNYCVAWDFLDLLSRKSWEPRFSY
jgi:predicted dithiol-disulfide oxidoreductase (DUF899 family)